MKKLLIGTALCALLAAPAVAAESAKVTNEPIRLSLTQMDGLTAGTCVVVGFCFQSQRNVTRQTAVGVGIGGLVGIGAASNHNATAQIQ